MDTRISAPLLSRLKSWQLIGLGLSGWCTLYSIALLTWGASSTMVGNTQGGCFAATMTLAGFETKRYRKGISNPAGTLDWVGGISTEHLNQTLAQVLEKQEFRIEASRVSDTEVGFGVRVVNAGRTMVFETGRWQEPVIDLGHAQTTENNRIKVRADLAVIVSAGKPDEAAQTFARSRPVRFLAGKELKTMLAAEKPGLEKI